MCGLVILREQGRLRTEGIWGVRRPVAAQGTRGAEEIWGPEGTREP